MYKFCFCKEISKWNIPENGGTLEIEKWILRY